MSKINTLQAPDYNIFIDGNTYVAAGKDGYLRDTSLETLWDTINSTLSRGPVVEFDADTFTVDASLEIQYEQTVIRGQGPEATILYLDDSVDDDVIRNQSSNYYRNTRIENLAIDGNRSNNTTGRGIEYAVTAATGGSSEFYEWLTLNNLVITECDLEGLYMQSTSGVLPTLNMMNCRIWDNDGDADGHQIHLDRIFDSFIGGDKCMISSARFKSMTNSLFENIYWGGGIDNMVEIDGGDATYHTCGLQFTNNKFDNASGTALLLDDYAKRNTFVNCSFQNMAQGATTGTYPCVEAAGNAEQNLFVGCTFGFNNIANTNRWTYAFEDSGSSDYNMLLSCLAWYGEILSSGNSEHFTADEENAAANTTVSECYKGNGNAWNA